MRIQTKIEEFLEAHNFIHAIWDRDNLTCYTEDGTIWHLDEFTRASLIWNQWINLEIELSGSDSKVFYNQKVYECA